MFYDDKITGDHRIGPEVNMLYKDSLEEVQRLLDDWLADDSIGLLERDQIQNKPYTQPPKWPESIGPQFVEVFLKYIESVKWDSEIAHIFEDELHSGILAAIAENRCFEPQTCARRALESHYIPFKRQFSK